jgi:aryl-alcohol dehydrogenase-like predicted oxidoreductase
MQTRRLGNSDMDITPIGLGAWAIGGGDSEFGWGPQDDADSIRAIRRALDLGINWIDTAAVYGQGHSEEVVARALAGRSARPYLFTKCAMVWDETRKVRILLTRESLRRECEASLRRLKADVIDLYQVHWPPPTAADGTIEEGWAALAELQREGKVRWIGVSNFDVAQLERAQAIAPVTSLQPPYSMLRPAIEATILPFCQSHGIGVISYSPMLSGMLTGEMTRERAQSLPASDWRTRNKEFREPNLSWNIALVDHLRGIGARHGRSPGEVAIAWVLRHPAITGAIVGARSAAQVEGWIGAGEFRLSAVEIQEIEASLQAPRPGTVAA